MQNDVRVQDKTDEAVWYSAVKITDKGWCAEFRIPYAALRFPDSKLQTWRVEFERRIRRRREEVEVAGEGEAWGRGKEGTKRGRKRREGRGGRERKKSRRGRG